MLFGNDESDRKLFLCFHCEAENMKEYISQVLFKKKSQMSDYKKAAHIHTLFRLMLRLTQSLVVNNCVK